MTDAAGRIVLDPAVMAGKPVVRGTRVTVERVLTLLAQGLSITELLKEHPYLTEDDVRACLAYAHAVIANDSLDAVGIAGK